MSSKSTTAFWYASPQKLKALSAESGRLGRLSSVQVGLFPPSIRVGLEPGAGGQRLARVVARLEKRLRRAESVVQIKEVPTRGPVTYFEYQGPTARRVFDGAIYVAGVADGIGILLVGSAANAIGAPTNQPMEFGSESPIDAIKQLFEGHGERQAVEEIREAEREVYGREVPGDRLDRDELRIFIDQVHARIIAQSGVELGSLPHTRGIALYAGAQETDRAADVELAEIDPDLASVPMVVVGSPIWVEQVTPASPR